MAKEYINREFLYEQYVTQQKSVKQIRREFGWGINTIKRWLRYHEIPLRDIRDDIIRRQRGHTGNKNPRWLGKRNLGGYIYTYFPEHPHSNKQGYVAQHRIIAEQILGRYLLPSEVVHHKDGDRAENDKTNLFPTTKAGHRKASASLMAIGFKLYKSGQIIFNSEEGIYQWMLA